MKQPRLVKAGTEKAVVAVKAPQVKFTNWSLQFKLEYEAEKAARPSAQQQWRNLFQAEAN